MNNMLKQLGNDQVMLLLYIADELDASDHRAVEARLAAEPALRVELEKVQALTQSMHGMLVAADAAEHLPQRAPELGREVARQITRQQLQPVAAPAQTAPRRIPLWAYPAAAAAIVLLAMLGWWSRTPTPSRVAVLPPTHILAPVAAPHALAPDPFANEDSSETALTVDHKLSDAEKQLALVNGAAADPAELFAPGW